MSGKSPQHLFDCYRRELDYLRVTGGHFAQRYPRVAHRLQLSGGESPDPHVERLIESFAFLSARVRLEVEDEFSEISQALLDHLYPNFLSPVPSLSIAQFSASKDLKPGQRIDRHTLLYAEPTAAEAAPCRFRTCYPVTMWPFEVTEAQIESPGKYDFLTHTVSVAAVLRLRIECLFETSFDALEPRPDRLRLHLHGDWMQAAPLYDVLSSDVTQIAVYAGENQPPAWLPTEKLQPVGFARDEDVLPSSSHAHPAYRLLQEYFAFQRKFSFFDVDLGEAIERLCESKRPLPSIDLLFLLNRPSTLTLEKESFLLGCTPIVNLFPKLAEPVHIDGTSAEYRLVSDWRLESSTEIHSIERITATDQPSGHVREVAPLYSLDHAKAAEEGAFWCSRRRHSQRVDVPGTEMLLSFWDLKLDPLSPGVPTVFAHTLCTNRHYAEQLQPGTRLLADGAASQAKLLYAPTSQLTPPLAGATQWRLVSRLTLNHVSLRDPGACLKALHELLRLYNFRDEDRLDRQIRGILDVSTETVVGRVGHEAWRGFCRGMRISLWLDDKAFVGGSALLLGAVLSQFFALYTSINSFTQVRLMRGDEEWKTWEPMTGWL